LPYVCVERCGGVKLPGCYDLINAWDAGARDFPRLQLPQVAPPVEPMQVIPPDALDRLPLEAKKQLSALNRAYDDGKISFGRALLDAQSIVAPALAKATSALQAIKARKPPDPWVPSCDEDFWIPDAGT